MIPKSCGTFFNGFSELKDYSYNSSSTNLVAIVKIFMYCTFVIPVSVYVLSAICDRFVYNEDLSEQDQRVDTKAQESFFNQKMVYNESPSMQPLQIAYPASAISYAYSNCSPSMKSPSTNGAEPKGLLKNGEGIRKKLMFQVYKASLWVEKQSHDPRTVISSEAPKSIRLEMLRDVPGEKISEAITEGFNSNSKSQMSALSGRLQRLNSKFPSMKQGDTVQLTYTPGKGTAVSVQGEVKETIEGKDFADALFSVWLGNKPVQEDLKTSLLGG